MYKKAELEVVEFNVEDVIVTSSYVGEDGLIYTPGESGLDVSTSEAAK